jgi:hypothetical protein
VEITKLPLCGSDFPVVNLCNFRPEKTDFDLCKDFLEEKTAGIFQIKRNYIEVARFYNMFQPVAKKHSKVLFFFYFYI